MLQHYIPITFQSQSPRASAHPPKKQRLLALLPEGIREYVLENYFEVRIAHTHKVESGIQSFNTVFCGLIYKLT